MSIKKQTPNKSTVSSTPRIRSLSISNEDEPRHVVEDLISIIQSASQSSNLNTDNISSISDGKGGRIELDFEDSNKKL